MLKFSYAEHMEKCNNCVFKHNCSTCIPRCTECNQYDDCLRIGCRAVKETLQCRYKPKKWGV